MKNHEKSKFFLTFLDLEEAYDAIPHDKMWMLEHLGFETDHKTTRKLIL